MTVIPKQESCAACGAVAVNHPVHACSGDCYRTGMDCFVDAATVSSKPKAHLHVTCSVCGFTWINDVAHPQRVSEAW